MLSNFDKWDVNLCIKDKCTEYSFSKICKRDQIVDISNDNCISRLIKSLNSSCTMRSGHHIPTIEELEALLS